MAFWLGICMKVIMGLNFTLQVMFDTWTIVGINDQDKIIKNYFLNKKYGYICRDVLRVMGPGQNFLTRVGLGQPSFGFRKFPLKIPNFSIFFPSVHKNLFGLGQKITGSNKGWTHIYCGSKVWVGSVSIYRTFSYPDRINRTD